MSKFALGVAVLGLSACSNPRAAGDERARVDDSGGPTLAPLSTRAARAGAPVFPYEMEHHRLENGLQVVLVPMPSDGLAAYWTLVRTGSRDEVEPGVTGFAHFFEHMLFAGTPTHPSYDAVLTSLGADFNASTWDDYTGYYLSVTRDDLPTVIEVESDRFQNLTYTEERFRTEAGAVYGEYRKGRTSPFEVLFEAVQNAAFDVHTYKHTTIGFEADIQAMPEQFEYSKTFFERFYRPENCVVLVAGDFDRAATLALIREKHAGWSRGYVASQVQAEPEQTSERRIEVPFDGQTPPLATIHWKSPAFAPGDRAMVAGTLLGELAFGETSPLYKKLVLDEQRLLSLRASFGFSRDPSLWNVIARVKQPDDVPAIERELRRAAELVAAVAVDPARLDAVRSRIKYEFLSNLTTPSNVCESLAPILALTGDAAAIERYYATLAQVTPEDVRAAAQTFLASQRSTYALLAPQAGLDVARAAASRPAGPIESSAGVASARRVELPAARTAAEDATTIAKSRAVLLPVAQDPNVALRFWIRAGAQDDPPGKEGLAALTAAMITDGGSRRQSYEEILAALFPMAAGLGGGVDKEMTSIVGNVHRDHAASFYALMAESLFEPGFRAEDFERLKSDALSTLENTLRFSSDEELGKAALYESVFGGTRYAHLSLGTVASLSALTLDDVRAFYARHYTSPNITPALGGAFEPALERLVLADVAARGGTPTEPVPAPEPAKIEGRNVLIVQKQGPTTAISFGHPIDVHRGSREYYALWIANSWLGEHRNSASHLYQAIREARGMNYGDYSYIEAFPRGGSRSMPPTGVARRAQMFEVWIRPVREDQALFALRAALREVEQLVQKGLTRDQFEFQRKFLKNYGLHFAETTADRLGYAVDDRFYGLDGHLATFRRRMDEITLEEVNAAIKKHLGADDLWIAMVTEHAEALRDALVLDAPSPIDYDGVEKPAAILEEDREIERWPLRALAEKVHIRPVESMFAGGAGTQ